MIDKKDAPEEIKEEAAAEKVEEETQAEDKQEAAEEQPAEEVKAEPAADAPRKPYMQRRKSFAQGSVPNAHRGYNPKTPVIMLGIIFLMLVASFILASMAG